MIRLFDSEAPVDPPRLPDGVPAAARSDPPEPSRFRVEVMRSLRIHRRLVLGFALVGLILSALYLVTYGSTDTSMYTARSLVYIQPPPSAVSEATPPHWPYDDDPADSYIQQQMQSMMRPDVLAGAVRKLAPGVWQQSGESDQSAADRLRDTIAVTRVGSSHQVAITARAANPDTVAALANAVAASYIENTAIQQKASDAVRLAMLNEEQERIKKELDDDRAEQAQLNAQLGVAAPEPEATQTYASDIGLIQAELETARSEHDEAAARLISTDSGGDLSLAALNADADQLISIDPDLSSRKDALLARCAALVSRMSCTTPDDPQYMQDQKELEQIGASLESEAQAARGQAAERIEEQLRRDLDRTATIEARLNSELAEMTQAAPGAVPKLERSNDLANDITRLQNLYNAVAAQLQSHALANGAPRGARLAEAAVPPAYPAIVGVLRNALLLLFAFILLGFAAAVVAHETDPHKYIASVASDRQGASAVSAALKIGDVPERVAGEHPLLQPAPVVEEIREAQTLPQFESHAVPPPAQQEQEELSQWLPESPPWWMTKTNAYVEPPMKQPRTPRIEARPAAARQVEKAPVEARRKENLPEEIPTRLSALRGIVFSSGIKELSQRKAARQDGDRRGTGSGNTIRVPALRSSLDLRQAIVVEKFAPRPKQEPAEAKTDESIARAAAARWETSRPDFPFPSVKTTQIDKKFRWTPANLDDIQTLPSKPGQYKH